MQKLETDRKEYQDVPQHEGEDTSSIGRLWLPGHAYAERIKGFYTPGIIRNDGEMRPFLEVFSEHEREMHNQKSPEATRISMRAIVDQNFLKESITGLEQYVEAVIPLDGTQFALAGTALVYFGTNHETRSGIDPEIEQKERKRYQDNLERARNDIGDRIVDRQIVKERIAANGYELNFITRFKPGEVLTQDQQDTLLQMSELYATFGWKPEEVLDMLTEESEKNRKIGDPRTDKLIGVIKKDGKIVSAGIAELVEIPINGAGTTLNIAEITEAATLPEYAGNGLYTAVSTALLEEIADRSQKQQIFGREIDLIYGECNGNAPGVLRVALSQGRTISGLLPQHVKIKGEAQQGAYNDLFPAYLNKETLYTLYGGAYDTRN